MTSCRRRSLVQAVLALVLVISVPAQRTWVVDSMGRPGSDFTDIPPAVAAAAPGDLIQVLATGHRYLLPVFRKGVRLVGIPDRRWITSIDSGIVVSDLPADQTLTLSYFWVGTVAPHMDNCAGSIHLDHVQGPGAAAPNVHVTNCRFVTFRNCVLGNYGHYYRFTNSTVFFIGTRVGVGTSAIPPPSFVAIDATDSRLVFVNSVVTGTGLALAFDCYVLMRQSSVLRATNCETVIGAYSRIEYGPIRGPLNCRPAPPVGPVLVTTGGTLWIDPRATTYTPGHGTATIRRGPVAGVWSSQATIGGTVDVQTFGDPNSMSTLFASLPRSNPVVLPGLGSAWVDPLTAVLVDSGPLDSIGDRSVTLPVLSIMPEGMPLLFQAVETLQAGGYRLSDPAVCVLRY